MCDSDCLLTAPVHMYVLLRFNCMMKEFYDLAGGMNRLSNLQQTFCDSMERNVLDSLSDYSGIIHTLPILVRLHEDAMEVYDTSKEKDTVIYLERISLPGFDVSIVLSFCR